MMRMFPVKWPSESESERRKLYESFLCPKEVPWGFAQMYEEKILRLRKGSLEEIAESGGITPVEFVKVLDSNGARLHLTEVESSAIGYLLGHLMHFQFLNEGISELPVIVLCPGCEGSGNFFTECCSGAGGCSCQGDLVDTGPCRVCEGRGVVKEGDYNPHANLEFLQGEGLHFVGSGPAGAHDLWPNRGNFGKN